MKGHPVEQQNDSNYTPTQRAQGAEMSFAKEANADIALKKTTETVKVHEDAQDQSKNELSVGAYSDLAALTPSEIKDQPAPELATQELEFKEGDKVSLARGHFRRGKDDSAQGPLQADAVGEVVEVDPADPDHPYKVRVEKGAGTKTWWYHSRALRLAEPAALKFKVGDRVRLSEEAGAARKGPLSAGGSGEIIEVDAADLQEPYCVRVGSQTWWYHGSSLSPLTGEFADGGEEGLDAKMHEKGVTRGATKDGLAASDSTAGRAMDDSDDSEAKAKTAVRIQSSARQRQARRVVAGKRVAKSRMEVNAGELVEAEAPSEGPIEPAAEEALSEEMEMNAAEEASAVEASLPAQVDLLV